MTGCKATYHSGRLLCTVSLVLSLFALAGNTAPASHRIPHSIVAHQQVSVKRAVLYKTPAPNTNASELNALLAFNSLVEAKYAQQLRKQQQIEITTAFRQLKTIPPAPFEALPA